MLTLHLTLRVLAQKVHPRKYAGREASAHTPGPATVDVDDSVEQPIDFLEPHLSGQGFLTPHTGFYSADAPHL